MAYSYTDWYFATAILQSTTLPLAQDFFT